MAVSNYGNESISMLTGADRVRKRPGVIFGSDGLEGCEHAVFEILSNSIDEAREGYGKLIVLIRHSDNSIEVEDFGRGCPVDWNENERRFNWELVFCELYAGGKYANELEGNYEYSLGLNGLGSCATQYSSEFMNVEVHRDGKKYTLHFVRGELAGNGMEVEPSDRRYTGTKIHWKPDLEVFTDINIPTEYFIDTMKKQAVVNKGITFRFIDLTKPTVKIQDFKYENGIVDYANEIVGNKPLTQPFYIEGEKRGRDRADLSDYNVKMSAVFCFSNEKSLTEYYHNSSWLEHGGSPDKAARSGFVWALDEYTKKSNKYKKGESKITFPDIQDSLILITNCFSTQTSYENQTKKSITNKFIQDAMTDFFKEQLTIYLTEHKQEADRIVDQILVNKRSRETAEKTRINLKKKLSANVDISNRVQKFVDCRSKDREKREIYICLKGDTRIKLLNGTDPTIESLVGQSGLWAYSTDEVGRMIPAKITSVFKTQEVHDTLKIKFDDGSEVECTPEHRFLDKDALSWVEAKDLHVGQSMTSMKFQMKHLDSDYYSADRPMVWIPGSSSGKYNPNNPDRGHWEYVHRRVAKLTGIAYDYEYTEHNRMEVHHKDFNPLNNDPTNFDYIDSSTHRRIHNEEWHSSGRQKEQFKNMSPESRKRMQEGAYHRTPEGIERQKQVMRDSWEKDRHNPKRTWARYNNPPKFWEDIEKRKPYMSNLMKERWNNLSEEEKNKDKEANRQGQYRRYKIQCIHIGQSILDAGLEITEENWEKFRPRLHPFYSSMLKYFGSVDNFVEEVKNYNLRVVSIEPVHYDDSISVYCLNIDSEFHSFVLSNGIVTHNCEGDSAAGSIKIARDAEFQGLLPVRGKILNCLKVGYERIFASEIITDLLRVLGCGVQVTGKKVSRDLTVYDINKLKWNKIIICTDADVDGFQIRTLILTMLYRLTPDLIDKGKVYIAESPLYEIITKDKTYFAYSDKEKQEIVSSLGNTKLQINRSKGLGENDPDMMWLTTMNPATRKLIQVLPSDAEETSRVFDMLLGDNLAGRKQHIADVGSNYLDQLDIS